MKSNLYTVKDIKSRFWAPKIGENDDSIKRDFAQIVNQPGNLIHDFPQDFELYLIGQFDFDDGSIEYYHNHVFVCRMDELRGVINAK